MEKLLVFIPAYNCEKQVTRVLSQLLDQRIAPWVGECIVVNNRSADGTEAATAIEGGQSVTDGGQGNGGTLTDEQRQKVEELLAQNAQSAQSDSDDSGSAAKQDSNQTSSPAKPW